MRTAEQIKLLAYNEEFNDDMNSDELALYINMRYVYKLFSEKLIGKTEAQQLTEASVEKYNEAMELAELEPLRQMMKNKEAVMHDKIMYDYINAIRITSGGISLELVKDNCVVVVNKNIEAG